MSQVADDLVQARPRDHDAERMVVGSALIDPDGYDAVDHLGPPDFDDWRCREVWAAMGSLRKKGLAIDRGTLRHELGLRGTLDEVDREGYIVGLLDVPTAIHIQHYAEIVLTLSRRRKLIRAGADIVRVAHEETDFEAAHAMAMSALDGVRGDGAGAEILEHHQATERFFDHQVAIQKALEDPTVGLIDTPWKAVNDVLGRLRPGSLTVVAGITGGGKTSLAEQIVEHNARRGKQAVYFHLEYSDGFMLQRRMARLSGVPLTQLGMGVMPPEVQDAMCEVDRWLGGVHYVHCPSWSPERIAGTVRRMRAQGKCDLAVVDYLQLVKHRNVRGGSKTDAIAESVGTIKDAFELAGVPGILLSQLSREHERQQSTMPTLRDLRGCGEIEEKANYVLFVWPRRKYETEYLGVDTAVYFRKPFSNEFSMVFDEVRLQFLPVDGSPPPTYRLKDDEEVAAWSGQVEDILI